jgi:predicted dehydrogenase
MARRGVGIIGTGWGAWVQEPAFRAAGLDVVALAGRQAGRTRRIAAELEIPFATDNWRDLLTHDEIAVISIVTPTNLHCEMAMAALEAGKHVLCEKPIGIDSAEARQMAAAARARPGQLALIDHELRFLPAFQLARRLVTSGAIGRLRHAEARMVASSHTDLQRPWNWWDDASQGGGILGAVSAHQIDILRYMLDDEVAAAQGVLCTFVTELPVVPTDQRKGTFQRPVTADDFAALQLRFRRAGVAMLNASMVARIDEPQSISLYGDQGTLRFAAGRLLYADPGKEFHDITPPHSLALRITSYPDYAEATTYLGHALRAALDGDLGAIAAAATFEDGLHVQQVLDAVRCSHALGQGWVTIAEDR